MEKCDSCMTRYVCEGKYEFDCKEGEYYKYNKDSEKCRTYKKYDK